MAELRVKGTGTLKLFENDNTSSVTIASPASLGADRTITLPDASVTLASGTMLATDGSGASLTALNASELGSGTVPTARLGSGTASSSTILYGDQTYKTAPAGITDYDVWYLTTDFTGAASPIASNLASLASSGTAHLGSAMTESSGVFTFPSTGMWQIIFNHYHYGNYNSRYVTGAIQADSGAGYGERAAHTTHLQNVGLSTDQYAGGTCMWFFDVTNVATCFVKFYVNVQDTNVTTVGNATGVNNMHFIRIGDT